MRCSALWLVFVLGCGLKPTQKAQLADTTVAAPDFTLPAQTGEKVALAEVSAANHVVLVFYRGHW